MPPTVRLLASTFNVLDAFMVTAPVPKFKSRVPANAKSAFQYCKLLVDNVTAPALVLSTVPPLITNLLAPMPFRELMANVPALSVVNPE